MQSKHPPTAPDAPGTLPRPALDRLVPTQSQKQALQGSEATPSQNNRYLTEADAPATPAASRLVRLGASGELTVPGALEVTRGGTDYTGKVLINVGLSTNNPGLTMSASWQDVLSISLTVPTGGGTILMTGFMNWVCSAFTANEYIVARIYIDGTQYGAFYQQVEQLWDRDIIPFSAYHTIAAGAAKVLKLQVIKQTASNTVIAPAYQTQISWALFA